MAYSRNPFLRPDQQTTQLSDAPSPAAASSAAMDGGAPAPQASGAGPSGWVNLQKYFDLNQGRAGALADRMAAPLEQGGQNVQAGIKTLSSGFDQAVNAGVPSMGPPTPGPGENEGDLSKLDRERHATYTGPSSLSNMAGYDDLSDRARQVGDRAGLYDTEEGRTTGLQEMFGRVGNYSPGAARFDSYLVGQAGGDRFGRADQAYGKLSDALTGATADSTARAASAAAMVEASRKRAENQYVALTTPKPQVKADPGQTAINARNSQFPKGGDPGDAPLPSPAGSGQIGLNGLSSTGFGAPAPADPWTRWRNSWTR